MNARGQQNWAARTDIGRVRTHNEDSVLGQPPLFVVADGLGGHEAGEVASSIAVETLRDHAPRRPDARALGRAVRAANREVLRAAHEGIGRSGMGTTMTAAIIGQDTIALAQVGDSRAYLLRGDTLQRLTEDHSMVADLIRRGQLSEAESRVHPNRSVITRALGTDSAMEADTYEIDVSAGDRLLLCSDGLTSMLEDGTIEETLRAYRDPDIAARALIDAANAQGGNDNISVIVVDIEDGPEGRAPKSSGGGSRLLVSILAWLLGAALVIGGIGYGVYRYARTRFFVIAEKGVLATYRGVPGEVAGYSLNWRLGGSDVPVEALPPAVQQRLADGVVAESPQELNALVNEYRALAGTDAAAPPGSVP